MIKDLKKTIEGIALKKIFYNYPEAIEYKAMIKFNHTASTASLDLALLPPALVKKIEALFD